MIVLFLVGCSNSKNLDEKDSLCKYKPSIGGCEEIYYNGSKCNIINEGQCQDNKYQVFKTLEDCKNLCE